MELEAFGRMLQPEWSFENDEKEFDLSKFKPKSAFNPKNKDAAIKICLSSLDKRVVSIETPKDKYKNHTREEWRTLFDLKIDKTIVIKGDNKALSVVFWDRYNYVQETEKQMDDKGIYQKVSNNPQPFIETIYIAVGKITKRGNLPFDSIKYFTTKDTKFVSFYLLPKVATG